MKSFLVLVLAVTLSPSAIAQHQTFVINPDASQVRITLQTTHEVVNGNFRVQSGSIDFDRSTPRITGSIIVLSASGKTGNGSRDKKMNRDILQVEQHATISFAPTAYTGVIAPSGSSTLQVTGLFTLLGTPHEITIPIVVQLAGSTATARAHFLVPYIQWGLKDPSFLFWKADKNVAVDLDLSGALSK